MEPKRVKCLVESLAFDCWCNILEFLGTTKGLKSTILSVKGLWNYIIKTNSLCLRHIPFELIEFPKTKKPHVRNLVVSEVKDRFIKRYNYEWSSFFDGSFLDKISDTFTNLFSLDFVIIVKARRSYEDITAEQVTITSDDNERYKFSSPRLQYLKVLNLSISCGQLMKKRPFHISLEKMCPLVEVVRIRNVVQYYNTDIRNGYRFPLDICIKGCNSIRVIDLQSWTLVNLDYFKDSLKCLRNSLEVLRLYFVDTPCIELINFQKLRFLKLMYYFSDKDLERKPIVLRDLPCLEHASLGLIHLDTMLRLMKTPRDETLSFPLILENVKDLKTIRVSGPFKLQFPELLEGVESFRQFEIRQCMFDLSMDIPPPPPPQNEDTNTTCLREFFGRLGTLPKMEYFIFIQNYSTHPIGGFSGFIELPIKNWVGLKKLKIENSCVRLTSLCDCPNLEEARFYPMKGESIELSNLPNLKKVTISQCSIDYCEDEDGMYIHQSFLESLASSVGAIEELRFKMLQILEDGDRFDFSRFKNLRIFHAENVNGSISFLRKHSKLRQFIIDNEYFNWVELQDLRFCTDLEELRIVSPIKNGMKIMLKACKIGKLFVETKNPYYEGFESLGSEGKGSYMKMDLENIKIDAEKDIIFCVEKIF